MRSMMRRAAAAALLAVVPLLLAIGRWAAAAGLRLNVVAALLMQAGDCYGGRR